MLKRKSHLPSKSNLGPKSENRYDILIGLWTQFWNETFQVNNPLDPNWVKALMATESSFNPNCINKTIKNNVARGLLQITKQTYKIAVDSRGELEDVLFRIEEKDPFIPDVNVALSTRWVFRKREILKSKRNKDPTWEEVMGEYKGIHDQPDDPQAKEEKRTLRNTYDKISKNH